MNSDDESSEDKSHIWALELCLCSNESQSYTVFHCMHILLRKLEYNFLDIFSNQAQEDRRQSYSQKTDGKEIDQNGNT